jgi:hypothetical protein
MIDTFLLFIRKHPDIVQRQASKNHGPQGLSGAIIGKLFLHVLI